jgi:hypothetical protein
MNNGMSFDSENTVHASAQKNKNFLCASERRTPVSVHRSRSTTCRERRKTHPHVVLLSALLTSPTVHSRLHGHASLTAATRRVRSLTP